MASATHTALASTANGDDSGTVACATISPVVAVESDELTCERRHPHLVGCSDEVRVPFEVDRERVQRRPDERRVRRRARGRDARRPGWS